ncbi:MAG: HupE/UreJ family protein [Gammaproteobacteria bacterium]
MNRWKRVRRLFLALCGLSVPSSTALAHPPGLSSAEVSIASERIAVVLSYAVQDLEALAPADTDGDAEVSDTERAQWATRLVPLAEQSLTLAAEGKRYGAAGAPRVRFDDAQNVHFDLSFDRPAEAGFSLHAAFPGPLPAGHRQLVSVQDADGRVLGERMAERDGWSLEVAPDGGVRFLADQDRANISGSTPGTFVAFLTLGVEHILTGYDHLLFLFALLVVSPGLSSSIKIITAFTVAHSITLGLATFHIVEIQSAIVEPLIAATIVYVGLENLVRREPPRGRWFLTFLFGLVHGFGFAGVLRDLGVGSGDLGIALPLFSFNLGVELGQLMVAACLLPLLAWLRGRPALALRWVPVSSLLVVITGGYWLAVRTLPWF